MGQLKFLPFLFVIQGILQGCTPTERSAALKDFQLPLPTKDEVALVNGRTFSISEFLSIRSILRHPSDQRAYWVGVAALALQNENGNQGKKLPFQSAVAIARYALNDISAVETGNHLKEIRSHSLPTSEEIRKEIESILAKSVIQRGNHDLSLVY